MEAQQNERLKKVEPLIDDFCKIILTDNDCLNHAQAEEYIDNLTDLNKSNLNLIKEDIDENIKNIALIQIISYLQGFQTGNTKVKIGSSPFQFDSGDNFFHYRKHFESYYASKNNNAPIPHIYNVVFDYIQETSNHYRIFEQFYAVRSIETSDTILAKTKIQAESAVKSGVQKASEEAAQKAAESVVKTVSENAKAATRKAVDDAANKAQAFAEVASETAKNAMEKAKDAAENAAKTAVDTVISKEMTNITKHISETSVTILGIFAGIVLTVVAGLFYSSSVLKSVNAASLNRLLCVSSLIGLVCLYLIVLMFRFIGKTGEQEKKKFFSDGLVIFISVVLIAIMVVTFIMQLK